MEPIIELVPENSAELLEDFRGDGYHAIKIPELDFPVYGYVFYHDDFGIMIDEQSIVCKPPDDYGV